MSTEINELWNNIARTINTGDHVGYAYDECHKIYVILDPGLFDKDPWPEYAPFYYVLEPDEHGVGLELLKEWFNASCGLRFIQAVTRDAEGDNVYTDLIEQFHPAYDEDDED